MFIFILWIRLEACLFSGRRVSILSIQKCSVPSSCKTPVVRFIPTIKISLSQDNVMIQRSSLSLMKLGLDQVIIFYQETNRSWRRDLSWWLLSASMQMMPAASQPGWLLAVFCIHWWCSSFTSQPGTPCPQQNTGIYQRESGNSN